MSLDLGQPMPNVKFVCTLRANLSALSGALQPQKGLNGETFWRVDHTLAILFGGTSLKVLYYSSFRGHILTHCLGQALLEGEWCYARGSFPLPLVLPPPCSDQMLTGPSHRHPQLGVLRSPAYYKLFQELEPGGLCLSCTRLYPFRSNVLYLPLADM